MRFFFLVLTIFNAFMFLCIGAFYATPILAKNLLEKDLVDTIQAIQKNDLEWQANQYAYAAGKQTKGIGRAYILPSLVLSGEHKLVSDSIDCNDQSTFCGNETYDSTSYQLELVQPLFNVEKWRVYKEANSSSDYNEMEYQLAFQNNLYDSVVLYFEVLRAQEVYQLSLAEYRALAIQRQEIEMKAEAGIVDQIEVIETQAKYDLALANQLSQFDALKAAMENLSTRSGLAQLTTMSLSEDYPITPLSPDSEDAWVEKAKKNSLHLKVLNQSIMLAEREYKKNSAKSYPQVDLFASFGDQQQEGGLFVQNGSSEAIGLRLSMPLFSGLGDFYAAKQQKLQFFETSENIAGEKQQFFQSIKTQFRTITNSRLRVQAREKSLQSAEHALKAIELQYDIGSRNRSDVLQAQQNVFSAKQSYADEKYRYILNTVQLSLWVGDLSMDYIQGINQWLVSSNISNISDTLHENQNARLKHVAVN